VSEEKPGADHGTREPDERFWKSAYAVVLGWLVVVILLLALFTRTFS
jgi:hypothetical protein